MRTKLLAVIIAVIMAIPLLVVFLVILTPQTYQTAPTSVTEQIPLNADTIFDLVNAEREKAGLKPLVRDARLDGTAQERADDMTSRNYFSHYDPITGESLVDIKPIVTDCAEASENISNAIYQSPDMNKSVVDSWMLSKLHHDAILLADYDNAGIGLNGTKIALHFCNLR